MKKDFLKDFDDAWSRIESNVPFAHARYADGEILLMKGLPIGHGSQATDVDKWTAPNKLTQLGKDLRDSLNCTDENYYYAIPCDTSSREDKDWLLNNIKQDIKYITFANLWINGNYSRFIDRVSDMKKGVTMIANQRGEDSKYPFKVNDYMSFGDDCVNTWENNSIEVLDILKNSFMDKKNETFFISVGPLSEVIISFLWRINPDNQYIDIGSVLDQFIHGKKTRPYMIEGTYYNKQICEMEL